jgi:predicted dehydrogenase
MDQNQTPKAGDNRRSFIKKTAAAGAVVAATGILKTPVYGQNTAPSTGRVIGANDRISVAVIGVGFGIGKNHLEGIHKNASANNVVVAGASDLFSKRRDFAKERAGITDDKYVQKDYRKILELKDIDAVLIATHDVWHARITCEAMEAGKHVYCEKPMTRYLDEGFKVYDCVKKTGKVFQVGSQGCSAAGWHKAAEIIRSGKVGQLVWSDGSYCRNNPKGEWNYPIEKESTPDNIDWETWLGEVKKRIPFSADHFHRWRKYYPYCGGLLGDLMPHRLHPLMLASGNPEFPKRVTSIGTIPVQTDKKTPDTPMRDVPEHVQLAAEFPSGHMLTATCSTVNAKGPKFSIHCHKATFDVADQGNSFEVLPERDFAEEFDQISEKGLQHEDIRVHEKNWFDCIRSGKAPNGNIDLAIRVQAVISLAEMSERLKIVCYFDEKTRKVSDGAGKEIPAISYGSLPLS